MSSTQSESPLAACVSSHVCMMDASRRKSSSREWLLLPWIAELFAEVEIGISENQGTSPILDVSKLFADSPDFSLQQFYCRSPISNFRDQEKPEDRDSSVIARILEM